jgi:type II secretory pathway component PulF
MTIPPLLLGLGCVVLGFLLTFVFPIQRGRLGNQVWDLITLALFVAGAYFINYYDLLSNLIIGASVGFIAILIRDFRLWAVRFRDQVYRRSHRYYWYGRVWGGRRRRW